MTSAELFTPRVAEALAELTPDLPLLGVHGRLRRALGDELGRQAAELYELRKRAVRKLGSESVPFLTRKGLEQATAPTLAANRARRMASRASQIWDATSGIGLDSLALARLGVLAVASDLDPHTAACAQANLRAAGFGAPVIRADAGRAPFRHSGKRPDGVLIDPDRRVSGARSLDPERWSPSLSSALAVAGQLGAGCLKLAPALDPALTDAVPNCRAEWTSLGGALAEVSLWLGAWATGPAGRAALLLGRDGSAQRLHGQPRSVQPLSPDEAPQAAWLAEPDPAVIRSGLLGALAIALRMQPLGPQLAYLGGPEAPPGPFLRAWKVLGTSPLDRKKVRRMLAEHGIGPLHVRKRGHPDTAEALAKRFAGPGEALGHLAVARLERGHLALLLEPGDGHRPIPPALGGPRMEAPTAGRGDLVGDEGFEPPTFSV
jgi:hypothetical protein